ncbi:MAG TPA: hypothetical protein VGC29_02570 [Flavisolibacter sp.]
MKRNLLISFILLIIAIIIMRWQGSALITPVSPKGIIDLEFARTTERFNQLRLFLDQSAVLTNIYLDFIFIVAYTWFLYTACNYIRKKTGWNKWSLMFSTIAITAGMFDVCENFLLLLIFNGRFMPSLMEVVFWCAAIKFVLAGAVVVYLLLSWPFTLRKRKS